VIEVEVHSSLRDFLKEQGDRNWPHHLTMARLVARALRLGRPALMQTGSSISRYCLSYLTPVLLGDWPVIIVAPPSTQQHLWEIEIPRLQNWLGTNKQVRIGDRWEPQDNLLLTNPESWLRDRINHQRYFPQQIPTIIDRADNLGEWTRKLLTVTLNGSDWDELLRSVPQYAELIRNTRVKLTKSIFAHPQNPYQNYLLSTSESKIIEYLCNLLADKQLLTPIFRQFWQKWQEKPTFGWTSRDRDRGLFTIYLAPAEVGATLKPIWQQQPVVIIGSFLDRDAAAPIYRQQLGLDAEILGLKFAPNRQNDHIQLYLPDRLPMPNTPQFQAVFIEQAVLLVGLSSSIRQPIVLIVEDVPLQAQVGSALAAEFGSRVEVEKTTLADDGILICGWSFWKLHQEQLPTPRLLIIATLPLPSLENPLVASRVAYYKNQRQDWFRMYLLPTALSTIQEAVLPVRESQGIVALLDNRVNFRSYGKTILSALEPCARINYLDPTWFGYLGS